MGQHAAARRGGNRRPRAVLALQARDVGGTGEVLSAATLLLGSAWASGTVVVAGLGPFDSPYQPAALNAQEHAAATRSAASAIALARAAAKVAPSVSVITNETSSGSSGPIFDTGREFLPVGGFTGRVPSPTLAQFVSDVRAGRVAWVFATVTPHPQPRHAVGHRTLHSRPLRQGSRWPNDALLPLCARRR